MGLNLRETIKNLESPPHKSQAAWSASAITPASKFTSITLTRPTPSTTSCAPCVPSSRTASSPSSVAAAIGTAPSAPKWPQLRSRQRHLCTHLRQSPLRGPCQPSSPMPPKGFTGRARAAKILDRREAIKPQSKMPATATSSSSLAKATKTTKRSRACVTLLMIARSPARFLTPKLKPPRPTETAAPKPDLPDATHPAPPPACLPTLPVATSSKETPTALRHASAPTPAKSGRTMSSSR
jgi:hypothetical protein